MIRSFIPFIKLSYIIMTFRGFDTRFPCRSPSKPFGRIRNQPELMSDTDPVCNCSTSWLLYRYHCNKVDCTFSSAFINCACWPCSDFFVNNIIFHSKNKFFWLWFHLVVFFIYQKMKSFVSVCFCVSTNAPKNSASCFLTSFSSINRWRFLFR